MLIKKLKRKNIKLVVIENEKTDKDYYFEIVINRRLLEEIKKDSVKNKDKDNRLTDTEKEVLINTAKGKENRTISKDMDLSLYSIKMCLKKSFLKLGVKRKKEAIITVMKDIIESLFG